jgi:phenylacetate-CoA ligase
LDEQTCAILQAEKSTRINLYYVTKALWTTNVKEFVVKQTKIDTFEVEYVSENALTESQIQLLKKQLQLI